MNKGFHQNHKNIAPNFVPLSNKKPMEINEIKSRINLLLSTKNFHEAKMESNLRSRLETWAKDKPDDAMVENDIKTWAESSKKEKAAILQLNADMYDPEKGYALEMEPTDIKKRFIELLAGTNSNDFERDNKLHSDLNIWAKAEPGDDKAKIESNIKKWADGKVKGKA